jgi:uncharacterized protein YhbP (UPF0306 family)
MATRLRVDDGTHEADNILLAAKEILAGRDLISMATCASDLGPHANSAFFAFDDELVVWFVSERTTQHSLNLAGEPRMSASVFLDPPAYGEGLRGVQLWGNGREARPDERELALMVMRERFATFAQDSAVREKFLTAQLPSVFYRFEVGNLTVLDEPRLGRRVYVPATVDR